MTRSFFFLALSLATAVEAGVYKWVDRDGAVHYSDRPLEDSEQVHLKGVGSAAAATEPPSEVAGGAFTGPYQRFEIVDPPAGESLHPEKGEVRVSLLLEPALQPGHRVALSVNGQPVLGDYSSTQLLLRNVGLGSHTVRASISDAQGTAIASTPEIQFHVRRPAPASAVEGGPK